MSGGLPLLMDRICEVNEPKLATKSSWSRWNEYSDITGHAPIPGSNET